MEIELEAHVFNGMSSLPVHESSMIDFGVLKGRNTSCRPSMHTRNNPDSATTESLDVRPPPIIFRRSTHRPRAVSQIQQITVEIVNDTQTEMHSLRSRGAGQTRESEDNTMQLFQGAVDWDLSIWSVLISEGLL